MEKHLRKCKLHRTELSEDVKLNWSKQLLSGLKYLKTQKVVHRDIKPANILITNKFETLKFADFGLGIQIETTNQLINTNCGSYRYMAPEVGLGNYNDKCDVWLIRFLFYYFSNFLIYLTIKIRSVGCVIYELNTLRFAFNGKDEKSLTKAIRSNHYERLSEDNIFKELIEK